MVASINTVQEVIRVVRRHVDRETFRAIIAELRQVPGNTSFVKTIKLMERLEADPDMRTPTSGL